MQFQGVRFGSGLLATWAIEPFVSKLSILGGGIQSLEALSAKAFRFRLALGPDLQEHTGFRSNRPAPLWVGF